MAALGVTSNGHHIEGRRQMTNAERQAAYRARQKAEGRTPRQLLLTDDEAFYLERVLEQMRKEKSVPAMMRRKNGTLSPLDA